MGNSILAGTLSFNPILQSLALAQEKLHSPPAQLWPAPARVAFAVAIGSWPTVNGGKPITRFRTLALATITEAENTSGPT